MTIQRWINYLPHIAWAQAFVGTMGSLYFSEFMNLPPCVLCWYQRIAMYPLVAILAVGILRKDKSVALYALPFALAGLAIAVYHNLLYWNILPESIAPCTLGISCTTKFFEWFGFITIPLMSLTAFSVLTLILMTYIRLTKKYA